CSATLVSPRTPPCCSGSSPCWSCAALVAPPCAMSSARSSNNALPEHSSAVVPASSRHLALPAGSRHHKRACNPSSFPLSFLYAHPVMLSPLRNRRGGRGRERHEDRGQARRLAGQVPVGGASAGRAGGGPSAGAFPDARR